MELRDIQRIRKSERPKRSKLFIHKADIMLLRDSGASFEDIRMWLRKNKRLITTSRNINTFYNKHCKGLKE
ncbi:hypothetical protein N478_03420 [Pseudoalteromonas luteoviolacea S4060-1]|uniref:Uncharacterized protein n=1 Tax=Pseudoalteromonas luteoviolacea S4060-1 TaxID=1365257 RepID=A0A162AXI5_9GAMM|nr:hypothetical protein N478_03420 [Pseudoalteromonas luteoviolacea S4060-1]